MKKSLILTLFALTVGSLGTPSSSFASEAVSSSGLEWQTDFNKAQQQATNAKKPLLLFFTGSDWCGWCKKLDKEILSTSIFQSKIKDQFVLVELDFPNKAAQDDSIKKQNQALKDKYKVKGFPTIILVDYNGDPIGMTGYSQTDPASFADRLLNLVKEHQNNKN